MRYAVRRQMVNINHTKLYSVGAVYIVNRLMCI